MIGSTRCSSPAIDSIPMGASPMTFETGPDRSTGRRRATPSARTALARCLPVVALMVLAGCGGRTPMYDAAARQAAHFGVHYPTVVQCAATDDAACRLLFLLSAGD